jgi:hypothetical protein
MPEKVKPLPEVHWQSGPKLLSKHTPWMHWGDMFAQEAVGEGVVIVDAGGVQSINPVMIEIVDCEEQAALPLAPLSLSADNPGPSVDVIESHDSEHMMHVQVDQ